MKNFPETYSRVYGNISSDFHLISESLSKCPDGQIINVGCGIGREIECFLGRESIFVEKDSEMIRILERKINRIQANDRVKVLASDAMSLDFDAKEIAGSFFINNSLAEIHPSAFLLYKISCCTKENGRILISTQNPEFGRPFSPGPKKTTEISNSIFYYSETHPLNSKGPNTYLYELSTKEKETHTQHFIEQCNPPILYWQHILESMGFQIENLYGDFSSTLFEREKSKIIIIDAVKNSTRHVKKPLQKIYDELAPQYKIFITQARYSINQYLLDFFTENNSIFERILDLGCGDGSVGKTLKQANPDSNIFGIDFSKNMLEESISSGIYSGVMQYDLNELIFPIAEDSYFDLITLLGVSEFLDDLKTLLRNIHRILRSGGKFIATFELSNIKYHDSDMAYCKALEIRKQHYSKERIKRLLNSFQFSIESFSQGPGYFSHRLNREIEYVFVVARKVGFVLEN